MKMQPCKIPIRNIKDFNNIKSFMVKLGYTCNWKYLQDKIEQANAKDNNFRFLIIEDKDEPLLSQYWDQCKSCKFVCNTYPIISVEKIINSRKLKLERILNEGDN